MKDLSLNFLNPLLRGLLIGLLVFGLVSCDKEELNCLPYVGVIFPHEVAGSPLYSISCFGGVSVKVINTSVDSYFEVIGGMREANVIGVRIPQDSEFWTYFDFPLDKDDESFKQKFYFDFRDWVPADGGRNVCDTFNGPPSRVVVLTSFSISRCEQPTVF
jgi:hypothetical protein